MIWDGIRDMVARWSGKNDGWRQHLTSEHEKQEVLQRSQRQKETVEKLKLEMCALVEEHHNK
jgi:hypothetical protein